VGANKYVIFRPTSTGQIAFSTSLLSICKQGCFVNHLDFSLHGNVYCISSLIADFGNVSVKMRF